MLMPAGSKVTRGSAGMLVVLADDRRDLAAFEAGAHDLVAADILDLADRDRHAFGAKPHIFGPDAELDGARLSALGAPGRSMICAAEPRLRCPRSPTGMTFMPGEPMK